MELQFELSGYRLFVKVEGEGAPVLLLHSYWGSHTLFDPLAMALSKQRMVIRIDLPGHGKSGNPPVDFTFDQFADVLSELLFRLNVWGKISIIGHSMGGYAALAFAGRFSERVEALALMHSPARAADNKSIKIRDREGLLLLKGKRELLLQVTIPSNFAPGNAGKMPSAVERLTQTSCQVTLEGALGSIHAINHRGNSLEVLQKAQYPILIITGKYDNVYNSDEQLNEASQIPNSEVLVLNHSGHLGFMEEEEVVIRKLEEFLNIKCL